MSEEFQDDVLPKMTGHVLIRDPETGQVILDKRDEFINKNAIHIKRMLNVKSL